MKNIKSLFIAGAVLALSGTAMTSCDLDLAPIDYYGSGSYWKTEAQVDGYIDGLHSSFRSYVFNHTIIYGEMRGGMYKNGNVSADGQTIYYGDIRNQNFDADHTGVSSFGGYYGALANVNLFISRVTDADYVDEAKKKYYLGIAYGLRAFYYFDLYRLYGGVPLRLDVKVIDGEIDPNKLYLPRSTAKQTMDQIKSDIATSLEYFGSTTNFDPYGKGVKAYWSKAATECLAGEVYLWNAKVTTGDNTANTADLATAKQHLENVMNNYGLKMMDNFSDVFDAQNHKGNSEEIMVARYMEGEATNSNVDLWTYSLATGSTRSRYREDGTPWNDPFNLAASGGAQWLEYNPNLFLGYDKADSRRDATFMASYTKDDAGNLQFAGSHVRKNIGYVNAQGARVSCGDYIIYRLPWVYLSLAEIANMEGDNASVKKYIDMVRKRAYGTNWDEAKYGFTAGDFTTNELGILHEKDKEFVQEGQRWWDLRRMTLTKGGKHLVFCKEGSLDGSAPVLDESQAYKVLWPLDKGLLNNDPQLEQTPGYTK